MNRVIIRKSVIGECVNAQTRNSLLVFGASRTESADMHAIETLRIKRRSNQLYITIARK